MTGIPTPTGVLTDKVPYPGLALQRMNVRQSELIEVLRALTNDVRSIEAGSDFTNV